MVDSCSSLVESIPFLGITNPLADLSNTNLNGYVIVVTGSNTGVGKSTATRLVLMGATVVLACRSMEKGTEALNDIVQIRNKHVGSISYPFALHGQVLFAPLDLSDLCTIRPFVSDHLIKRLNISRVDVLINNAGLNTSGITKHGLQQLFQVNYLGHFHLFQCLLPLLQSRDSSSNNNTIPVAARVVNLSSVMHHVGGDDYVNSATTNDGRCKYYDDSKYFMNLFTLEINRLYSQCPYHSNASTTTADSSARVVHNRSAQRAVVAVSVNPGAVRSDIWRAVPWLIMTVYDVVMRGLFLHVDQGAGCSVYASFVPIDLLHRFNQAQQPSHSSQLAAVELVDNPAYSRFVLHPFIPYLIPYYAPFNSLVFEAINVYTGPQWGTVSLTRQANETAVNLWKYSTELIDTILSSASHSI